MPVLRVDAQFTVIEAALKGYMKWRASSTQQSLPDYVSGAMSHSSRSILTFSRSNSVLH